MRRTVPVFGLLLLLAVAAAAGHGAIRRGGPLDDALVRSFLLGAPVLEVRVPRSGEVSPIGGVEVLIRFQDEGRVAPETLRCLLNGRDVTDRLRVAANGAGGALFPLTEGQNLLRVEVFAGGWWTGGIVPWSPRFSWYFEDAVEVSFRVRPPTLLDRA